MRASARWGRIKEPGENYWPRGDFHDIFPTEMALESHEVTYGLPCFFSQGTGTGQAAAGGAGGYRTLA